jgi:branched-chain amino acid transport system substrate-binding protein
MKAYHSRKRITRPIFIALAILVIASLGFSILFSACSNEVKPTETTPIKIGYLNPFSGPAAFFGPDILSGIQLALDEVNSQVAGRKIELIQQDNEGTGEKTLTVIKNLVELNKVDILIGIDSTPSILPSWDYLVKNNIPLVIPTCILENQPAPHAAITKYAAPNIFRVRELERQFNYEFAQWLYKNNNARNVMTLALDMPPGYWASEGFQKGITDLGGKVVGELYAPPETMDFAPYLAKIDPKVVDTLWVWHTPSAAVGLVKAFDEYGWKDKVKLVGFDIAPEPVIPQFGDSGVGLLVVDQYFSGVNTPLNDAFVKAYKAKNNNNNPDALAESGYDCMKMVLKALESTKGNTDKQQIVDALSKIASAGFDTPRGKLTFSGNQAYGPFYISKIEKVNGQYVSTVVYSGTMKP